MADSSAYEEVYRQSQHGHWLVSLATDSSCPYCLDRVGCWLTQGFSKASVTICETHEVDIWGRFLLLPTSRALHRRPTKSRRVSSKCLGENGKNVL